MLSLYILFGMLLVPGDPATPLVVALVIGLALFAGAPLVRRPLLLADYVVMNAGATSMALNLADDWLCLVAWACLGLGWICAVLLISSRPLPRYLPATGIWLRKLMALLAVLPVAGPVGWLLVLLTGRWHSSQVTPFCILIGLLMELAVFYRVLVRNAPGSATSTAA